MAIVEHCEQLKAELLSDKLTKRKVVHFFFVTFSSCFAAFSNALIDSHFLRVAGRLQASQSDTGQ